MRHRIGLGIIILCIFFAAIPAWSAPRSLTLNDFENEQELARFSRRTGITTFGLTTQSAAHGSHAARLAFTAWKNGAEQWPAVILPMKDGLPTDWSDWDVLAVTVHNESDHDAMLALHVADMNGQSASQQFTIPAGKTETLRYRLDMARVNVARVREVHLFSTRPPEEVSLVVDYLRLEEDTGPRLDSVEAEVALLKKTALSFGLSDLVRGLEERCRDLRSRSAESGEARAALRTELASLEDGARLCLPRAISEARMRSTFRGIWPDATYACGFATGMVKVFPKDVPFDAHVARSWDVELAGNEVESFQLLVLAGDDELKQVEVSVSPLTRSDGRTLKAPTAQVSPMGFVETKKPPYLANYVGWHPDPILDFLPSVDVKAGEMQPIWIRVKASAGTPAGEYRGEITVKPANASPVKLALCVKVWGFDVPADRHLPTALGLSAGRIMPVYGGITRELWHKYCDFTLRYRLDPGSIYQPDPPALDDIIRWNGRGLAAFNILYVPSPAGLKANDPYPEDAKQKIMEKLDAFIPKIRERGLVEKAYIYGFDEVRPESFNAMKDIFSTIKAKYPDVLTMTTAYDDTYGKSTGLSEIDAWVPLTPKYDMARAADARSRGKRVWWYICIVPKAPYANWLIEYDAIDTRSLMGLQTAKYQPDGFLYYAINRWPLSKKPITEGPYTDWNPASYYDNNGDGSIMCAGPDGPLATIRMENIRDGIEDYEYFWVLRREIDRLKAISGPEAYRALRQAESAERIGDDLVRNLQSFSKSPEALYAKRRRVAEAILAAKAVTTR